MRGEVLESVEPVIGGTSLVELVRDALDPGRAGFAGLSPSSVPVELPPAGQALRAKLLGCACGDEGCSYVTAVVTADASSVRWASLTTSNGEELPLGPYRFEREAFDRAIRAPVRAEQPIRRTVELGLLLSCVPRDHLAWLDDAARYVEDRWAEEERLAVLSAGFQAFARDNDAVAAETLSAWASARALPEDLRAGLEGLRLAAAVEQRADRLLREHSSIRSLKPFVLPASSEHPRDALGRLQRWIAEQAHAQACPTLKIQLVNEARPFWVIDVEFAGTALAERPFTSHARHGGPHDFARGRRGNASWQGLAGPLNLEEAIDAFLERATE